jgi:chromosome segregation ATPase
MANPRDLAEQAFALLQDALRESEARAENLNEQLERKKAPKSKLDEQLDVLSHRLQSVEEERLRWQREASHLEEVVEAERAKIEQLKKKLEVAEGGPEKLTKKEINFWRAKAEDMDTETREYKTRIANLRRDLLERDAIIERLKDDGQSVEAPTAKRADTPAPTFAQQSHSEAPPAGAGELAELKHLLGRRERELATFKADLAKAQAELAAHLRIVREAQSTGERTKSILSDREHRLVEVSAELEQTRAEIARNREREDALRDSVGELGERIAALTRDLENARRHDEQRRNQLQQVETERDKARSQWQESQRVAQRLSTELEELRTHASHRDQQDRDQRAASEGLQATVAHRDRELAERERQIIARDEQIADRQRELHEYTQRLEEHTRLLVERDQRLAQVQQQLNERDDRLGDFQQQLNERDQQVADQRAALDELERVVASLSADLEQARSEAQASNRELAGLRDTSLTEHRELELLRQHKHRLEAELSDVLTRIDNAELQKNEIREQISGLEAELKEEKETTDNLSELANERREQITKLTEQVEEANERYEEAKWRLGKAAHFERLVKRRKGLVKALLEALRAKNKSNTALKAGLDGLRTHKAAAEANQQKLLGRIDSLKAELEEAEEMIARQQGSTNAKEQLVVSETRTSELEARLNAQAELIQSLEADLKAAKMMSKSGDEKNAEIALLHEELAAKDKDMQTKLGVITRLQADVDEQQRRLAKLRGSETETLRLKAITEKDRNNIDALEREVAQLREALTRQSANGNASGASGTADLEARLRERESSVTRLMGTVKEHESTIKKLSEAVESWKRKYQFLSADAPDAYKAAGEK